MTILEIDSGRPAEDKEAEMSADGLRGNFERHLRQTLAKDHYSATDRDRYYALALAVRDQLVDRWIATQQTHHKKNVKRVYYLSLEFLIGRLMGSNVINLHMDDVCRTAMLQEGLNWEDLREYEIDAGLGNGGLGRLAACFLDSIATMDLPAVGYGLRYDFGIFKQNIKNGYQVEQPEEWLKLRYPWEIPHPEFSFEVQFEGRVETRSGPRGLEWHWVDTKPVIGIAYDLPIVGYGGRTVNTLRLWSAKSAEEFDLDDFNRGEYVEAVVNKVAAENLTKVLYPDDTLCAGKNSVSSRSTSSFPARSRTSCGASSRTATHGKPSRIRKVRPVRQRRPGRCPYAYRPSCQAGRGCWDHHGGLDQRPNIRGRACTGRRRSH